MGQDDEPIVQIDSHGVGAAFLKRQRRGVLLVLAHEYTTSGRQGVPFTSLRLPFGTGEPGEPVRATLIREMHEEVAADPHAFDFDLLSETPIYWCVAQSERTGLRSHLKVVYAAQHIRGEIRTTRLVTDAGTPREEVLSPPAWYEVGDLLHRMMNNGAPRVHRLAVVSALCWAASQEAAVAARYAGECRFYSRALASFEPSHPIVADYLAG